jgi:hypothetical protein
LFGFSRPRGAVRSFGKQHAVPALAAKPAPFTSWPNPIILLPGDGISIFALNAISPHFSWKVILIMRAEAEALVQSIEQSMGLLRRHL